jgi:hypothetical protein
MDYGLHVADEWSIWGSFGDTGEFVKLLVSRSTWTRKPRGLLKRDDYRQPAACLAILKKCQTWLHIPVKDVLVDPRRIMRRSRLAYFGKTDPTRTARLIDPRYQFVVKYFLYSGSNYLSCSALLIIKIFCV